MNGGELVTADTNINVRVGGNITSNGTIRSELDANTWVNINGNGIIAQNPNADNSNVFFRGRTSGGDDKVTLFADGSITADGDGLFGDPSGNYVNVQGSSGTLTVISDASTGNVIQYARNGAAPLFGVDSDGAIIAAGYLRSVSTPGVGTYVQADDSDGFQVINSNFTKAIFVC